MEMPVSYCFVVRCFVVVSVVRFLLHLAAEDVVGFLLFLVAVVAVASDCSSSSRQG